MSTRHLKLTTLFSALLGSFLVAACGESVLNETGGGAGDGSGTTENEQAIILIQPLVGVYELQDGWNGFSGDRASLVIRDPDSTGTAEAALIDFDDSANCYPNPVSTGEVRKDPFSDRLFMDDILEFDQAELFLSGSTLGIQFVDVADIDGDGNTSELVTVNASKLGIMETDLVPGC
jgi:hypothetical protein